VVHLPTRVAEAAATRHGIVTTDALLDAGVTDRQIRRLREAGVIVRVHNGVHRIRSSPDTVEARCAAACAAHPSVTIGGVSAGRSWGFRRMPRPSSGELVTALVDQPGQVRLAGVTVRRTTHLPRGDWLLRPDGIRITSPVRTALDLAADLDDAAFESVVEQLLAQRTCTFATLLTAREAWAAPGRRGVARANRVLGSRAAMEVPVQSDLELQVVRAMRARGIELVRQYPIRLPNGIEIHLDLADPVNRWSIEVDHFTWHGGRVAHRRDKERDRQLHLLGWITERVEDEALFVGFDAVIDELVALHAARAAAFRPRRPADLSPLRRAAR